jgi:hypothetical protein
MAASVAFITAVATSDRTPKQRTVTITGDTSYPGGGYALVAADVGLTTLHNVLVSNTSTGLVAVYNFSTGKLQLFRTGTSADTALNEVTAAVNVSTAVVRATFIGD